MQVNGGVPQQLPPDGIIRNLTNGESYTFAVAGRNEIDLGEFSPVSNAVVPFGLPGPPDLKTYTTLDARFSGADPNGSAVLRYEYSGPCLLYTSPSPRDRTRSRMPSSA